MTISTVAILAGIFVFSLTVSSNAQGSKNMDGNYNVMKFGAKRDGKTDDMASIQKALDQAAKDGGGIVFLPPGKYLVSGSLKIGEGVTLQGATESPKYIAPLVGSVIMATGGRGKEDGPALFEVGNSAAVRGLTVFYPEQKPTDIQPYPWTFHLFGGDNTVESVTLINSFNGIRVGPENNVRHRIRSVYGCVLRRGIMVDFCTDIGRIENVQFHCHWWSSADIGGDWSPVFRFMADNLEAFIFGRTDWEYVNNTFVFPVKIGYRFIATEKGACNGQFTGIGSDASQICIQVDAIQPMGLLITGGQFVAFEGPNPTQIIISESCAGSVRLVNCAFWGPSMQNIVCNGPAFLSLSDCYLGTWHADNKGLPLVEMKAGKLQLRGCTISTPHTAVRLHPSAAHAIISENNGAKGVKVVNEIGDKAIIKDNEPWTD